ncbi:hypothetical protein STEG23_036673 [Scotinomys teguina]
MCPSSNELTEGQLDLNLRGLDATKQLFRVQRGRPTHPTENFLSKVLFLNLFWTSILYIYILCITKQSLSLHLAMRSSFNEDGEHDSESYRYGFIVKVPHPDIRVKAERSEKQSKPVFTSEILSLKRDQASHRLERSMVHQVDVNGQAGPSSSTCIKAGQDCVSLCGSVDIEYRFCEYLKSPASPGAGVVGSCEFPSLHSTFQYDKNYPIERKLASQ